MKQFKILLVDDDQDIIKAVQVILENQNYTVVSANNKADGIQKAMTEKPDLFILDVMMEAMSDGFDLARDLRKIEEFKNSPIILLTAIDDKTGVNFKSAFGNTDLLPVDAYIEKPVAPHKLINEVDKLLSRKA
jgi:CheY-like chemotaxis protein